MRNRALPPVLVRCRHARRRVVHLRMVWVALALLSSAIGCAPAPRYERMPVPETPFTREKLEMNQRACEAKGKALQCVTTARNTQDCWCAEVPR